MKFKVQDVVKYISKDYRAITGEIGYIEKINCNESLTYKVKFPKLNNYYWCYEHDLKSQSQVIKKGLGRIDKRKGITKHMSDKQLWDNGGIYNFPNNPSIVSSVDEFTDFTNEQIKEIVGIKPKELQSEIYCSCIDPDLKVVSTAGNMIITKDNTYNFCKTCEKEII